MQRLIAWLVLFGPLLAFGTVLLTQEQAIKQMFPDADEVKRVSQFLTADQVAGVKQVLDGKWTLYPPTGKGVAAEHDSVTFFFAGKQGQQTGVALIESQPGKWGQTTYVIALDPDGKVTNLAVMSYAEQHGRPIATRRFLSQFIGKTSKSPLQIGKDVDAVSGATIVSRATAFAVKKVIVLYETVYLTGTERKE